MVCSSRRDKVALCAPADLACSASAAPTGPAKRRRNIITSGWVVSVHVLAARPRTRNRTASTQDMATKSPTKRGSRKCIAEEAEICLPPPDTPITAASQAKRAVQFKLCTLQILPQPCRARSGMRPRCPTHARRDILRNITRNMPGCIECRAPIWHSHIICLPTRVEGARSARSLQVRDLRSPDGVSRNLQRKYLHAQGVPKALDGHTWPGLEGGAPRRGGAGRQCARKRSESQ